MRVTLSLLSFVHCISSTILTIMEEDQRVAPSAVASPGELETDLLGQHDGRKPELELDDEEGSTHLNTSKWSPYLTISTDKLSARYTGPGNINGGHAIQGNRPAPQQGFLYYFEISVKNRGRDGSIAIGFTDANFYTENLPGWVPNSYGYHGDDGKLFQGLEEGDKFGPTFSTGDTVGAGINYGSQELFFTKNGKLVGTVSKHLKGPLYPTIGLCSPNEKVEVNFGQKPFIFHVQVLVQEERDRRQRLKESVLVGLSEREKILNRQENPQSHNNI